MEIMRSSTTHARSVPVNNIIIYSLPIPAAGSSNLKRIYKPEQI